MRNALMGCSLITLACAYWLALMLCSAQYETQGTQFPG